MAESKKSVKSLIYTLIMLAFMAIGWIVAPFGGLSEFGVKVLGIFIVLMIFGLSAALATPGASSRAGLVFGNTEWITTGQGYFFGIISVVCVIITLLCVGLPLGAILF